MRWREAERLLKEAGVEEMEILYTSPPWRGRPCGELRVVGVRKGRPPCLILAFEGHQGGKARK